MDTVHSQTRCLCPVCGRRLTGERVVGDGPVYLRCSCPEHGRFQARIWSGHGDFSAWIAGGDSGFASEPPCPDACGLCADHLQQTCCTLLEVTRRCQLVCPHCFADGGRGDDPPLPEVKRWIDRLVKPGKTLLQLSGGEPSLRDDLAEIVAHAKAAGCAFVQLNSNGIRLAQEPEFARELAEAGLSFVFLQFDGLDDRVYERLRGRPLLEIKRRVVQVCAPLGLGVTLVPTLVPGINLDQIGAILDYAVASSPTVRGVHFQPLGQLGRQPEPPRDELRLTLDSLLFEIEAQTDGRLTARHFEPSHCNHPLCGFHGDFLIDDQGLLQALRRRPETGKPCCCKRTTADENRAFISRRWQRSLQSEQAAAPADPQSLDGFIRRVRSHGFTISAMAFQDRCNLDIERLRRCSLHVFDRDRFVPFCVHYLGLSRQV